MRFGKEFASAKDPAFADAYLPYKHLKHIIRSWQSPPASGLSADLPANVEISAEAPDAGRLFQEELREAVERVNAVVVAGLARESSAERVSRVAAFAEVNVLAACKILKKCEKKCGRSVPEGFLDLRGAIASLPFVGALRRLGLPQATTCSRLLSGESWTHVLEEAASAGGEFPALPTAEGNAPLALESEPGAASPEQSARPAAAAPRARRWARSLGRLRRFVPEVLLMLLGVAAACGAATVQDSIAKGCMALAAAGFSALVLILLPLRATLLLLPEEEADAEPKSRACVWARLPYEQLLDRLRHPEARKRLPTLHVETVIVGKPEERGEERRVAQPSSRSQLWEPRLEQRSCPCCMEDFAPGDMVAVPRCGHIFCEACLREWAARVPEGSTRCPVCRAAFVCEEV